MAQININDPNGANAPVQTTPVQTTPVHTDSGTGHAVASGINLITTVVVLAVALVIVWLIFQMVMPMIR